MEACITGQTLCWRCRRATNAPGMGCSWSRRTDPEPVEGWEARETTLKGSDYYHGKNYDIPAEKVWKAIGQKPLFGHHSGRKSKTFWGCFMKGVI